MQEAVGRQLETLSYSIQLKGLIRNLLVYKEENRLTLQEVCAALAQPEEVKLSPTAKLDKRIRVEALQQSQLVHVTSDNSQYVDFHKRTS